MKMFSLNRFNVLMVVVCLFGFALAYSIRCSYDERASKSSPTEQRHVDLVTDAQQNDNPAMLAPSGTFIPPTPEEKAAMKKKEDDKKAEMAKLLAKSKPIPMKLISGKMPLVASTDKNNLNDMKFCLFRINGNRHIKLWEIELALLNPGGSISLSYSRDGISFGNEIRIGSTSSSGIQYGLCDIENAKFVRLIVRISSGSPDRENTLGVKRMCLLNG